MPDENTQTSQTSQTSQASQPAQPVTSSESKKDSGGILGGLGLGSFKAAVDSAKNAVNTVKSAAGTAVDSAKNIASQGQSGMSKITGTLSSVGGNVMSAVTGACDCPEINFATWDKKKMAIKKTFYKTFSTRIFGHHFSDAIDKNRGMIEIKVKDYKVPKNPMILDTNSLFLSTLFIEVEGGKPDDKKIVTFDKEFYCKVSKNGPGKALKAEVASLEQEMGKRPQEVYFWFVTCLKCDTKKEIKTVILAA